jgi:hypothetical protein
MRPLELGGDAGLWGADDVQGDHQPWYFGSSVDLSALALPKPSAMDCCPPALPDDDDVPLLTLDLGGVWGRGLGG